MSVLWDMKPDNRSSMLADVDGADPKTRAQDLRIPPLKWMLPTLIVSMLSACTQLDAIEYAPKISPEAFLQQQPGRHIQLGDLNFVWSQPTSSVIVFFVALLTIFTGYKFLSQTGGQRSKLWWGIGLLLTGVAAFLAGISYQALGYEIKCAGRNFCTFTSWWEIFYMLLSALGMAAFMTAAAYTNAVANARKAIIATAWLCATAYVMLLFWGVLVADKFLVSFELMAAFSSAAVVFFLVLHGRAYLRSKDLMNRKLLRAWLIFVAVFIAYVAYLSLGIGATLWEQGFWFTENDVLHLGMIYWVYRVGRDLGQLLTDRAG